MSALQFTVSKKKAKDIIATYGWWYYHDSDYHFVTLTMEDSTGRWRRCDSHQDAELREVDLIKGNKVTFELDGRSREDEDAAKKELMKR